MFTHNTTIGQKMNINIILFFGTDKSVTEWTGIGFGRVD
jgi:hypothetical protein